MVVAGAWFESVEFAGQTRVAASEPDFGRQDLVAAWVAFAVVVPGVEFGAGVGVLPLAAGLAG